MNASKRSKLTKAVVVVTIIVGLLAGVNSADARRHHRRRPNKPAAVQPTPAPAVQPQPQPRPGSEPGSDPAPGTNPGISPGELGAAGALTLTYVNETVTVPAQGSAPVTAPCPSGTQLLGGGAWQSGRVADGYLVSSSGSPIRNEMRPTGWAARAVNTSDTDHELLAQAVCGAAPDLVVEYPTAVRDAASGVSDSTARCPSGMKVTGGGVFQDSLAGRIQSSFGGGDAWAANIHNLGDQFYGVYVQAICASAPSLDVRIVQRSVVLPAYQVASVTSPCPDGTKALSGGAYIDFSARTFINTSAGAPSSAFGSVGSAGWSVFAGNLSQYNATLAGFALCAVTS